jgi:hypothetical protein
VQQVAKNSIWSGQKPNNVPRIDGKK